MDLKAASSNLDQTARDTEEARLSAYLRKRIVPTFGHVPITRPDGIERLLCANLNGLATAKVRNYKVSQIKSICHEYNISGILANEHGLNLSSLKPSETLQALLEIQNTSRSIWTHNKHEKFGRAQQGGCAIIILDELCQYVKKPKGASDWRGWGRWTSIILTAGSIVTRLVVAYNVGKPKPLGLKTVYQQLLRRIQEEDLKSTPRNMMKTDLVAQLKQWMQHGERIILFMDANENCIDGPLCSRLADIGLAPQAHRLYGRVPNTHVEGSECIEEVWCSFGIEITGIQLLSFHEGIADHRPFIVDFTSRSAIGLYTHRIVRPDCRRLVMAHFQSVIKYRQIVCDQCKRHRIFERLSLLDEYTHSYPVPPEIQRKLEILDQQCTQIQKHAESKCRKIFKIDAEYSLTMKYWHQRVQALSALIRRLDHKTKNDGNICRMARKKGISKPRHKSKIELLRLRKAARERKRTLKTQSKWLRREHLRECIAKATARGDSSAAKEIKLKLSREADISMWKRINWTTKDPFAGSLLRVEVEEDGKIVEKTTEPELVATIFDETDSRFSLAGSAPISTSSLP